MVFLGGRTERGVGSRRKDLGERVQEQFLLEPHETLRLLCPQAPTFNPNHHPTPSLTLPTHHSYGGREQALQEQAKARGGQLLGEAKESMGAVEAKGREVMRDGREMVEKVRREVGK